MTFRKLFDRKILYCLNADHLHFPFSFWGKRTDLKISERLLRGIERQLLGGDWLVSMISDPSCRDSKHSIRSHGPYPQSRSAVSIGSSSMNHVASVYELRVPFTARQPCSGCTRLNGDNDKEGKGGASEENGAQRKAGRHDDLNNRLPDSRSTHNREAPGKRGGKFKPAIYHER